MIKLTRLSHTPMFLNSDLIEHIDATPDTVVTLTSGQKIMVLEPADEVVEKIVAFRRSLFPKDLPCRCVHALTADREADGEHGAGMNGPELKHA